MTVKNTLRIRFTFNRATRSSSTEQVQLTRKTDSFASTVINNVGVEVARGRYQELKSEIQSKLKPSIDREIQHLAKLYNKFIVGSQRIGGTLTTKVMGEESTAGGVQLAKERVNLRSAIPQWKPLAPSTLRQKAARDLTRPSWFKFRSGSVGPSYFDAMSGRSWEQMFGPIHVSVQPRGKSDYNLKTTYRQEVKRGEKLRIGVATIRASVFGLLTPHEVSAIATGRIEASQQTGDGRTNGLLEKVQAVSPGLAFRLGNNTSAGHVYRPSLEPFLAFAITRSVPAAVNHRLDVALRRTK